MKKILFALCLIFAFFVVFTGCKSKNALENTSDKTSNFVTFVPGIVNGEELTMPVTITNHSFLTSENVGDAVCVVGKLMFADNQWILIENPDSKGRVTFVLEVSSSMENLFLENQEKTVKITGVLTNADKTWTKYLSVSALESVEK